jgi:hypothetical protein
VGRSSRWSVGAQCAVAVLVAAGAIPVPLHPSLFLAQPRSVRLPATVIYPIFDVHGMCDEWAVIQFPAVHGPGGKEPPGTSYTLHYKDSGSPQVHVWSPADDVVKDNLSEYRASDGTHVVGVWEGAGGDGNGCAAPPVAGPKPRFTGPYVVVSFSGGFVLSGTVKDTSGKPVAAVVSASGTARSGTGTDAAGNYAFALPSGSYDVSLAGRHARPASRSVTLGHDLSGVDFTVASPEIELVDPSTGKPFGYDPDHAGDRGGPYTDAPDGYVHAMDVAVGDVVEVRGNGFDPGGGEVRVTLGVPGAAGAEVVRAGVAADGSFTARFKLGPPPDRCSGIVGASQQSSVPGAMPDATAPIVVASFRQVIAVVGSIALPGSPAPLANGQYLCHGQDDPLALARLVRPGEGIIISAIDASLPFVSAYFPGTSPTFIDSGKVTVVSRPSSGAPIVFQGNIATHHLTVALPGLSYSYTGDIEGFAGSFPATAQEWQDDFHDVCTPISLLPHGLVSWSSPPACRGASNATGGILDFANGLRIDGRDSSNSYFSIYADRALSVEHGLSLTGSALLASAHGTVTVSGGISESLSDMFVRGDSLYIIAGKAISIAS